MAGCSRLKDCEQALREELANIALRTTRGERAVLHELAIGHAGYTRIMRVRPKDADGFLLDAGEACGDARRTGQQQELQGYKSKRFQTKLDTTRPDNRLYRVMCTYSRTLNIRFVPSHTTTRV